MSISLEDDLNVKEAVLPVANDSGQEASCYVKFLLQVQDFGCGIPADKLSSLFINFGTLAEH